MSKSAYQDGLQVLKKVRGNSATSNISKFTGAQQLLSEQVISWGFGQIYARPNLSPRDRELAILSAIVATGGSDEQLETHFKSCLRSDIKLVEMHELLLQLTVYCGFPKVFTAAAILDKLK